MKKTTFFSCFVLALLLCACSDSTSSGTDKTSVPEVSSPASSLPSSLQSPKSSGESLAPSETEVFVSGFVEPLEVSVEYSPLGFDLLYWRSVNKEEVHVRFGNDIIRFMGYEYYPERGVAFRYNQRMGGSLSSTYDGEIFNITMDQKYTREILEGISMQSSAEILIDVLGPPAYWDEELNLRGYKLSDCYLFFVGDRVIEEVSIYPRKIFYDGQVEVTPTKFFATMEAELSGLGSSEKIFWYLHDHLASYTYAYLAGDKYTQRSTHSGIRYANLGIDFLSDNAGAWKLTIYGNCGVTEKLLSKQSDNIEVLPEVDLVFESEKERVTKKLAFPQRVADEGVVSPNGKWAVLQNDDGQLDALYEGFYLVNLDGSAPSEEIFGSSFNPYWLSSRYLLTHTGWGVEIWDLDTKGVVFSESGDKFEHYIYFEDGKIVDKYYEGATRGWYEYSFDEMGVIHIEWREKGDQ